MRQWHGLGSNLRVKPGREFEQLSAQLFAALRTNPAFERVEHDVRLPGPDGDRQIDVLLRGRAGPLDILTIIECKDTRKLVTVEEVDALHSKLQDVRAQKAVMVAAKGFSGGAQKKAARLGISLCTAQQARHERWPLTESIPFFIDELACTETEIAFSFTALDTKMEYTHVCDRPVLDIAAEHWNAKEIEFTGDTHRYEFVPALTDPWTRTGDGRKQPIRDLKITMVLQKTYYFGYFNELASAKCLHFLEADKKHVIFDPNELGAYRLQLPRYCRREDVPKVAGSQLIRVKIVLPHRPKLAGLDVWKHK